MMTPVNRVYNAHILYDPQHGYYWLDEHLNESDRPSDIEYYATKTDACKAAVEWAKSQEYSVIILRSERLSPHLRLLSDNEITVKLMGKKGRSMPSGKILTIHLNEEQYLQLIYLISVAGEISHRSPSAYVITKLISSAYRRLIDND